MPDTEKKIEITSSVDYDDLSLYGIHVDVDEKQGMYSFIEIMF